MFFSVIIPTCNRNNLLSRCLDNLLPGSQELPFADYEVIVTDDGKNNEAKELTEHQYPWVKWTEGPKKGPAANRNCGARYASGEWLIFLDDDCLPDSNWLQEYLIAINSHHEANVFEGSILPDDWTLLQRDMAECPVNDKGGYFWSANIMIRKNLFNRIGGFDEQFKIAAQEDQDIYLRLKKHSPIIFLQSCKVIHPVRFISLRKKIFQIDSALESWFRLRNKNGYSFTSTLFEGFRSQYMALLQCLRKKTLKKSTYHFIVLMLYFPMLLNIKFIRNGR